MDYDAWGWHRTNGDLWRAHINVERGICKKGAKYVPDPQIRISIWRVADSRICRVFARKTAAEEARKTRRGKRGIHIWLVTNATPKLWTI